MSHQDNNEKDGLGIQSGLPPPPTSFHLPPPPTIKTSASDVTKTSLLASSLPPPPKIAFNKPTTSPKNSPTMSGLPPPPKIAPLPPRSGIDNQMRDLSIDTNHNVHSTQEQIPTLSSAPPSGVSLAGIDEKMTGNYAAQSPSISATRNHPIANHATISEAPSSSTSWSSFTQNASGILEKAGRMAINTVESAADYASDYLLEDNINTVSTGQETVMRASYEGEGDLLGMQQQEFQPQPQKFGQHMQQFHQVETQQSEEQSQEFAFHTMNSLKQQPNIDLSSPTILSTKTITHSRGFPNVPMNMEAPTGTPSTKTQTKRRAQAAPTLSTLAPRQSLLKVLIIPTADAQTIAKKNNTTLCDMFRIYGNSFNPNNDTYRPPLPPFRSANRSMMLSWDNLILDFVSLQEMESRPVSESVAELALGESARMWDEDHVEEKDEELERLEQCVADVLAEKEEEKWMRKIDGKPSMSSKKPKKGVLPYGDHDDDDTTFSDNENEALRSCADAAFALTSVPTTPWLLRFRHTLDCSTDGMSHELLCNPSVVILAASTSENYLICFAELANVHHLPRPYHDGRYDPNGLRREFLLLHDVINGPQNFDETKALAQMKERFGPGCCSILCINSAIPESDLLDNAVSEDEQWEIADPSSPFVVNAISEKYKASLANTEENPIRGACLSDTDKRAIRRFVANMVVTGLLPAVERRIANLNAAVSNAKRGVKNVIKSLWRKPKESLLTNVSGYSDGQRENMTLQDPTSGSSVKYRYDSIESQTRLLADTLFLMRDYEGALGVYRLVKADYKHDKAILYYASVQEMILLCMHMLDPYRDGRFSSDAFHSIETALHSYSKAADEEREQNNGSGIRPGEVPYATRLATRLCLVLSSNRSLTKGKHMEIADLLASASSHETPLGAAVLLEQSSAHYYRAGMLRKYAFHMLMAGHMFRSAELERHAFRCFAASLYVYHGERWDELRSHLSTALAAQLNGMGHFALSLQFYASLINAGGGRVSVRSQQKFVKHIIDICREHKSSAVTAVNRMATGLNNKNDDSECRFIDNLLSGVSGVVKTIEITNLGFPRVEDSSIKVCVENTRKSCISIGRSDSTLSKNSSKGDEAVWQDMMNCAEAELRASLMVSSPTTEDDANDGGPVQPSAQSGDENIDHVIMEIDKQERDAQYRERQKRKGKGGSPEIRAMSEPIAVSFSLFNPLGIGIDLTEMQLVASIECKKSGLRHTNEFAISKAESTKSSTITFFGSDHKYYNPEFMCQVPVSADACADSATLVVDSGPFFVVSNLTSKVPANSEIVVSLNICPLVQGDLKIHGFRFKLLDEVWVYNSFDLLGPLLQDTQINKATRARGESLVLRSKVEQKMPLLKVSVEPDSSLYGTVLQGQTSHWKLKLSNLGYAPASNIMLKTNAPWLNINHASDENIPGEDAPTSSCIGPSGTLMQVNLKAALGGRSILNPGETTEIPIVIRTSGGGRQEFYMLFRYELWSEGNVAMNLAPRHRWTREILSIPVYPSITMSASLMPSHSNKEEHMLSIELMNYRSDRDANLEIDVRSICIASRNFKVEQLKGQVYPEQNSSMPSLRIGWQERVTLHYRVVPTHTATCFSALSALSSISNDTNVCNNTSLTSSDGTHTTDFMCRERAHEVFMEMLQAHRVERERQVAAQEKEGQPRHVAQIRRARTLLPTNDTDTNSSLVHYPTPASTAHPTSISRLCPQGDMSNIHIICCWSALVGNEGDNEEEVYGQHHLRNLMVRPQNKSKGCPLALSANYKTDLSHDFDLSPLDVDLDIIVRNRLVEADVKFEFALDDQSSFDFIGTSSFTWELSGGNEITVPVKARIYSGGTYNLQSVRLTVLKGDTSIPYLFPLQWTVTIEDA